MTLHRIFKEAQKNRTEESKNLDLKTLCDTIAEKAGWHTVYVPNNRSKVKDRVKYKRAFDTVLFCELLCRFEKKILQQFALTNVLNNENASEKAYDCILRFLGTYKPDEAKTPSACTSRMLLSIRQRAIEANYEENTRYNLDSTKVEVKDENGELFGYKVLNHSTRKIYIQTKNGHIEEEVIEVAERTGVRDPDWKCHVEISLDATYRIGKDQSEKSLGDIIEDTAYTQRLVYREELEYLEDKYADNETQKILLRLLVEFGQKCTPAKLLKEYVEVTGEPEKKAKSVVYEFYRTLKEKLLCKVRA